MACGWPRGSLGGSPGRYFARSAENSGFEICRILPCPRTYFHERIRCRLDSAPTKQFAALQDSEVPAGLTALADRLGAADDGVLAGFARAAQFEGNRAPGVGDAEARGRQVGELRMLRRRVHLGLAELDQRAVDLGEEQEAAEGAALAETAVALRLLGCGHPGGPLHFLERAPAGGDALAASATTWSGPPKTSKIPSPNPPLPSPQPRRSRERQGVLPKRPFSESKL